MCTMAVPFLGSQRRNVKSGVPEKPFFHGRILVPSCSTKSNPSRKVSFIRFHFMCSLRFLPCDFGCFCVLNSCFPLGFRCIGSSWARSLVQASDIGSTPMYSRVCFLVFVFWLFFFALGSNGVWGTLVHVLDYRPNHLHISSFLRFRADFLFLISFSW